MRNVIAAIKISVFIPLSLLFIPIQGLGRVLLGNSNLFYLVPISYYRITCFIFRIKVQTQGQRAKGQVVYVGNHLSYIDIPVVGTYLNATFISKADVRDWPIFGILAALSRTVFIERSRDAVTKCISDIKERLENGRSLILFPEGTSSNGLKVLPFKSSIFELFLSDTLKPNLIVQPFTISLQKVDGRPVQEAKDHDIYAWYGDMTFFSHLWDLAKTRGAGLLLTFHPPRPASEYKERKQFALDCETDVAEGLAGTKGLLTAK